MRVNGKGWIKRGIAVGLMAVMACVNPLQTLSPVNSAQPVAKAAETKAAFVSEVRLGVDKDAAAAKQSLTDAGYEVIDQDLNEKAGSFWNEVGEQAVYMGIKRTDDESKAIRDMKTMNMLGKYSFTDLSSILFENRMKAKDMYYRLNSAIEQYRKGYNDGDLMAEKAHELLNYIVDDDSGKKVGDLFLEDVSRDKLITMFVEGNQYLVSSIMNLLILTSDQKTEVGDFWTERMSKKTSYNDIIKDYAREKYGNPDVDGEKKAEIKRIISSDLDDAAKVILDRWDEIRSILIGKHIP